MPHYPLDLTGIRSNSLTALTRQEAVARPGVPSRKREAVWLVRCDCGTMKSMRRSDFVKGRVKSCGCQRFALISQSRISHGMSQHPAYWVWRAMNDRCRLPTHQAWKNYGGRGITVCQEWQASFDAFWRDMGPTYQPGLSIDRIDNDGGYSPGNCAWKTSKEQNNNRRAPRKKSSTSSTPGLAAVS